MTAIKELTNLRDAEQRYYDELVRQQEEIEEKMSQSQRAIGQYNELIVYVGEEWYNINVSILYYLIPFWEKAA